MEILYYESIGSQLLTKCKLREYGKVGSPVCIACRYFIANDPKRQIVICNAPELPLKLIDMISVGKQVYNVTEGYQVVDSIIPDNEYCIVAGDLVYTGTGLLGNNDIHPTLFINKQAWVDYVKAQE